MLILNYQYFAVFALSFLSVGLLTPVMRKVAIKKNIFDLPNTTHKSHQTPTPYLGGVAIMLGIVLVLLAAVVSSPEVRSNLELMLSVLIPALFLGGIGLWDDLKGLPAYPRLLAQSVIGVFISILLISTGTLGNPTGSRTLDILLTVIWIVGICNSINFFDNLDGGAAGTVAISSLGLFVLGFQGNQFLVAALSAVTAGATIGFLLWNKNPARIYMGDAGALFLGVLIATLTIRLKPDTEVMWTSLATPLLLLAVPILDTSVAVLSRIRRGISPLQGGLDHLSHRLIRAGLSRKTAAISLWILSGFFSLCAIAIPRTSQNLEQIIVAIAALVWAVLFVVFFKSKDL
jgi:UDP-GlcNAc:undecaprenyl-phosphate GlcNAc-1-phosphate transferase